MNLVEKAGDQSIILYQLFFIYNYMHFKNKYSMAMFLSVFLNVIINLVTKKYLIEKMKPYNHKLPILGKFCRPIDKNCNNLNVLGYGMPSGHSQIASFIAAFYYFYYLSKEDFSYNKFILLSIIAVFVMYTRYTAKMHTIPQITLGSIYGIGIAFVLAKIFDYFSLL